MILSRFGSHFGSPNAAKMASKIAQKIDGFLDRSWNGLGAPKVILTPKSWPVQGPRGGVGKG